MSIEVVAKPKHLTWSEFKTVTAIPGTTEEAQVSPEMKGLEKFKPIRKSSKFQLPNLKITVYPNLTETLLLKSAKKTDELLAHEQGHYDLLILVARAMARELEALETDSVDDLGSSLQTIRDTHQARATVIDEAYDDQTNHSRNGPEQLRWRGLIKAATQNKTITQIDGFDL